MFIRATTAHILRNFYLRKSLLTYVKVRIVILSSQPTIFCNHASNGIYSLILFLKFVIQGVPKGSDKFESFMIK